MRPVAHLALLVVLLIPTILPVAAQEEMLWHYRNLGKAFYENRATQYDAVETFKKALDLAPDSAQERVNYGLALLRAGKRLEGIAELERAQKQDPTIPHTWFNLGIAYMRDSKESRAIEQLEGMLRLVPDEPITHYNLGKLYWRNNEHERALNHFERATALAPNLAGPHYQLAAAYRKVNRLEEAQKAKETFDRIKNQQAGAAVPEDLEWSFYAEIYETIDPQQAQESSVAAELRFETQILDQGLDAATVGLLVLDVDGDLRPDLLVWSAKGVKLYEQGKTAVPSGLEDLKEVVSIAAGDFDNDGLADLCVLTSQGAALYKNVGGRFEKQAVTLPVGSYRKAIWLDFDHDYDLDLFLLGKTSALVRNNGQAGFSDLTHAFPFVQGTAIDGVRLDVIADTQGVDLAVAYADRPGVLYRDRLGGKYEAAPIDRLPQGVLAMRVVDVNNDGWTDLAVGDGTSLTLLINDYKGGFQSSKAPPGARAPFIFADLENRTVSELVAGGAVYRNKGLGAFEPASTPEGLEAAVALATADFDADGKMDFAVVEADGTLRVLRNVTDSANSGLRVGLKGVKNLRLAPGAKVEVKTGRRYQKKIYEGLPLLFGVGAYKSVDTVRITWPNGTIQNEAQQAVNQAPVYEEAQRLSGSCPMIFAWNGQAFEFITDVLGVAPLGASAGEGQYFPVDHDEYVQIDGSALVAVDGRYEMRVTEELREVAYLDTVKLIAVDHPAEVEVFTNDKFKGPPFPEFRLFGVRERVYPTKAQDHLGRDVLDRLQKRDRTYPDGFARDYAGVAELHHLDLDFAAAAPDNRAILVLSGWMDWADGSTFLGMSQQNAAGLILPYIQVKNALGAWETVIEDMGIPAGKPKTIVVDLTGKFLSKSREIRIVTNLCVYWDEIFLGTDPGAPPVRLTDLHTESARLRFRGFSEVIVHPERKQPERFVYGQVQPLLRWNWNPTLGLYTRYGDVKSLLDAVDDLLVVMGSGDELQLRFDATRLPEVSAGWKRDFLLFVDGWAKDGDANTAFSQTVEPLPFHDMPQYPYPAPYTFPADGVHTRYREFYNTRPALRLIRALHENAEETVATFSHDRRERSLEKRRKGASVSTQP
jgi:tetratricopeptide (TPR) repeat protein